MADVKKEFPPYLNYNTLQRISGEQLYEFYPRTLQQKGEREVQIVESNPISSVVYCQNVHFQEFLNYWKCAIATKVASLNQIFQHIFIFRGEHGF